MSNVEEIKRAAMAVTNPNYTGDNALGARIRQAAISDFREVASPSAVLSLIEELDNATAKMKAAQDESLRLVSIIIGMIEGWQIVPTEPTIEMIAALGFDGDVDLAVGHGAISESVADAYKKALAVAPRKDIGK